MKRAHLFWIVTLVVLAALYRFRHYFFTELPRFSGAYTTDQSGSEKMKNDSIAYLAHKFVDEMKAAAKDRGKTLSEETYIGIESQLSECVRKSVKGKDTNALGIQEFVDTYVSPCAVQIGKSKF